MELSLITINNIMLKEIIVKVIQKMYTLVAFLILRPFPSFSKIRTFEKNILNSTKKKYLIKAQVGPLHKSSGSIEEFNTTT